MTNGKGLLEKVLFQVRIDLSCGSTPRDPRACFSTRAVPTQPKTPFVNAKMKQDEYAQLAWLDHRVHLKEEGIRQRQKAQRCADAVQALKDFEKEKARCMKEHKALLSKEAAKRESVARQQEEQRLKRERAWQERNIRVGEENRAALYAQIERKKREAQQEKEQDKKFQEEYVASQERQLLEQEAALKRFQQPVDPGDAAEVEAYLQVSNFKSKAEEYRNRRMMESLQRRRRMLETLQKQVQSGEEKRFRERKEEESYRRDMMKRLSIEQQAHDKLTQEKKKLSEQYCLDLKIQMEINKSRIPWGMSEEEKKMNKPLLHKIEDDVQEWRQGSNSTESETNMGKYVVDGGNDSVYPLLSPAMRSIC